MVRGCLNLSYKYLILFLVLISFFVQADAYLAIPPTPAIKMINGSTGNVTAQYHNSFVSILNTTGILVDFDYALNTITIGSSASGGGINNTISSIGTQQSIVSGQVNNDHQLKGIACGGDLQCSNNSTDVTISFTETGMGSVALDDLTDVILTSPAQFSILFFDGVNWLDQIFKSDTITCTAGQFFSAFDNQTGDYTCSSPTGSGFTTIASEVSPSGNATILAENVTGTKASFKTISAGTGIQIDNGSQSVIIKSLTSGTFSVIASELSTSNNATILAYNNSGTKATFKTISAGTGITITNGSNSIVITNSAPASGGATVLSGGNLTSATANSWQTIFTIPMTASSGNFVSGHLIAFTDNVATAVQFNTNFTTTSNRGTCQWFTPTAATTLAFDALNASGTSVGTAETTWMWPNATSVKFECGIYSSTSPGNFLISFKSETGGRTVTIAPGSFYIKTP